MNFIERAIIRNTKKMSRLFLLRSRAPSFFFGNVEVRQSYGGRSEIMNAGKKKKRSRRGTEESSSISGRRSGRSSLKSLPSAREERKGCSKMLETAGGEAASIKTKNLNKKRKKKPRVLFGFCFLSGTLYKVRPSPGEIGDVPGTDQWSTSGVLKVPSA